MKKSILFFCVLSAFFLLAGCATTTKKTEKESPYLTTLGDFSPFELGDAISVWKDGDDVTPCEMTLYCVPRTNKIEIHFSRHINKIALMMNAENCAEFERCVGLYMDDYNSGHFDKNHEPTKDNAYGMTKTGIAWGVFGYSYNADVKTRFNYEIIGGKPYFSMFLDSGLANDQSDVYSPKMTMYFSPSQLETIMELTDSNSIAAHIKALEEEAYSFEYEF
jgi:hypothetical protein